MALSPSSPCLYSSVHDYCSDTAGQYFRHIVEETGTLILWPSELKVGAKSKKGVCCVCVYSFTSLSVWCGLGGCGGVVWVDVVVWFGGCGGGVWVDVVVWFGWMWWCGLGGCGLGGCGGVVWVDVVVWFGWMWSCGLGGCGGVVWVDVVVWFGWMWWCGLGGLVV